MKIKRCEVCEEPITDSKAHEDTNVHKGTCQPFLRYGAYIGGKFRLQPNFLGKMEVILRLNKNASTQN